MPRVIDLRSDTVTQPTDEMRRAMAEAVVGDDAYGEDPTVCELEALYASMVGKPAALYVPSGIMANQVAMRVLTKPGDVVVAGASSHVVGFESGASARNASIQFHTIPDDDGRLEPAAVREAIRAQAHHRPAVTALCIENTYMAAGGVPVTAEETAALVEAAEGRPVHLDGARLFNAAVALGCAPSALAVPVTTVMSCLSKGLCAPVGSILAGPEALIDEGRIERRRLGGQLRQAGVLAAAGLVALRTMVDRLADDHRRARELAAAVARTVAPGVDPERCRTNIVVAAHPDAQGVVDRLEAKGVLCSTVAAHRVRFVTHAGIDDAMVAAAIEALESI